MDDQREDNQLEPIYNSSVPIQDVALKTIETGGERGSERSMLAARHNDDDETLFNELYLSMILVFWKFTAVSGRVFLSLTF